MKKKNTIVTPKGVINFPYLNEMDTAFKQNVYKATEFYILKSECEGMIKQINELVEEEYNNQTAKGKEVTKSYPYSEKGEYYLFKNKFKSQYKPKQIMQKNGKLEYVDEEIKAGSVLQFSLSLNQYTMMGKSGVSFYIDAVKIVELKDKFDILTQNNEDRKVTDFGFEVLEEDIENNDEELEELGFEIEDEEIDLSVDDDEEIDF